MGGPKHLWSGDWQSESEATSARLRPQTPESPDAGPDPTPPPSGRRRRVRATRLGVLAALVVIGGVAWGLTAVLGSSDHKGRSGTAAASTPGTQTAPQSTAPQGIIPRHRIPPGGFQPPSATSPQTTPSPTNPQATPSPTNPQATPTPTNPQATPSPTTPQQPGTSSTPQSTPNAVVGPIVSWLGMQIETLSPNLVVIDTVSLGSPADRAGLEPGDQILSVAGRPLSSATGIISAVKGVPKGHRVPVVISYGSSPTQQVELTLGAAPTTSP